MIDPESIHIHPDYQPLTSDADIAVLTLSEKIQFSILIRPICLWSTESSDLQLIVGKFASSSSFANNNTTLKLSTQNNSIKKFYITGVKYLEPVFNNILINLTC